MTNRRLDLYALLILAGVVIFVVLVGASLARAQGYEGVSVKHAATHVREARAALADAQRVQTATRRYTAAYGATVGRWVWLADDVGWPPAQWPTLFFVVDRESGGFPGIMNSQGSGAAGLLQEMPDWYNGSRLYYDFPAFNPLNPRLNLYYGYRGWLVSGWAPWSM